MTVGYGPWLDVSIIIQRFYCILQRLSFKNKEHLSIITRLSKSMLDPKEGMMGITGDRQKITLK